jgi:asparagine synthetase B (glutamine-hydrolysing)
MLIFLAGHHPQRAPDAGSARRRLEAIVAATPFAAAIDFGSWSSAGGSVAFAWAVHRSDVMGDVEPVACEENRAVLVAGRPIRWRPDGGADGRDAPRARTHLGGIPGGLDGRFAIVRADGETLEIRTDVLGAYPVYATTDPHGTFWASGLVGALAGIGPDRGIDEGALASMLAFGWPLRGQPAARAVRRLPRGVTLRIGADGARVVEPAPERVEPIALLRRPVDHEAAARDLVEGVRALADWPGRPVVVPVTGGRDSRVVLAAALAAGIPFEALTAGGPGQPDVVIARELCAVAGVAHRRYVPPDRRWLRTDVAVATGLVRLRGATTSLRDGSGFPVAPEDGPLPVWLSGQGGEIARGYYGRGRGPEAAVLAVLAARLSGWRPWLRPPLTLAAERRIGGILRHWSREWRRRGATPADLPYLAYLDLRMGFWAAAGHGAVEWTRDTASPLWSWKLMPALLGGSDAERADETFHRRMVALLAPQLVPVPFDDGHRWPDVAEPDRPRPAAPLPPAAEEPTVPDRPMTSLAEVQALVRDALGEPRTAELRAVLDDRRTRRLLETPEEHLDERREAWLWNLLTAVGVGATDPPGASPAGARRASAPDGLA